MGNTNNLSRSQLTPAQIRAGMALLNWEYKDLAKASGLAVDTLSRICLGKNEATASTREKIARAMGAAGIDFLADNGVRTKPQGVEIYTGASQFDAFYQTLYEELEREGGEVCLIVTDEKQLQKYRKNPELHRSRMKSLCDSGKVPSFRILAKHSNFSSSYATYRQLPNDNVQPTSFYSFGNHLALITFEPEPIVWLIRSPQLAATYRQFFDVMWAGGLSTEL